MKKTIRFLRISTWNSKPMFGDPVTVFDENGIPIPRDKKLNLIEVNNTIFCMGRSWPNPYKPKKNKPFDLYYGSAALGVFDGKCIVHPTFGKCICINEKKAIQALYPNPVHRGKHIIKKMYVHRPDPNCPGWPGSGGCLTVEDKAVDDFFALFKKGEKVKIEIIGKSNGYTLKP